MDHYSAHSSHAAAMETDSEKYLSMAPWRVFDFLNLTKRKAVCENEPPRKRIRLSEEETFLGFGQIQRQKAFKRRLGEGTEKASSPETGNAFSKDEPPRKRIRLSEEEIFLGFGQIQRQKAFKRRLGEGTEKASSPETGNAFSKDEPPRKRIRLSEEEIFLGFGQIQRQKAFKRRLGEGTEKASSPETGNAFSKDEPPRKRIRLSEEETFLGFGQIQRQKAFKRRLGEGTEKASSPETGNAFSKDEPPRKRIRLSEEEIFLGFGQIQRQKAFKRRLGEVTEKSSSPEPGKAFSKDEPPRKRIRLSEEEIFLGFGQIQRQKAFKRRLGEGTEKASSPETGNAFSKDEPPRKRIRLSEEEIFLGFGQIQRQKAFKRRLGEGTEKASSPETGNAFSKDEPPRKRIRLSEEEIFLGFGQIQRQKAFKRRLGEGTEKASSPETWNAFSDDKPPRKRAEEETLPTKHQNHVKLDQFPRRESKSIFAPQSSSALAKRRFKAKYKQQSRLGKGGCGSVYCGYRRFDKLPVAIKHVPKKNVVWTDTDENGQQLPTEVAVMLKLEAERNHSVGRSAPISLLDWYDLKEKFILVLERPVPAEDLYNFIENNQKPLDENQAKIIIKQLIHVAKHLEENKIFHRDIKPENLLIETGSEEPRLRLIDFGLSCFTDHTSDGCFYGTERHMPAEWLSDGVYDAGPATVWQIGAVLYEMLHNKEFNSVKFVKNKQQISKYLSRDCRSFLKSCLAKTTRRRFTLEKLQHHPWIYEDTGNVW